MTLRLCCLSLLAAVGLPRLTAAEEPLPEPPKPPRSAKLQPLPPAPEPVPAPALPSVPVEGLSFGSILTEPVALYPHVRVKDADDMAPGAVPVFVAVRDPNCGRGPAGLVFVKVCVPTCPLCKVRVKKGGAEVELDYGEYEIDVRSRNGVVTIEYED
jgi:hypothetical protein